MDVGLCDSEGVGGVGLPCKGGDRTPLRKGRNLTPGREKRWIPTEVAYLGTTLPPVFVWARHPNLTAAVGNKIWATNQNEN